MPVQNQTSNSMKKYSILVFLFICFSVKPAFNQDTLSVNFPVPTGFINDFEGILTPKQEQKLNKIITKQEKETSDEIAIVTIDSITPYPDLYHYSLDMANTWGIGKKGKDNGVLLIFSRKLRNIQIQTGKGLEKALTDEEAKRIIDQVIIPEFKKDNYYLGVKKGLMAILKELQ